MSRQLAEQISNIVDNWVEWANDIGGVSEAMIDNLKDSITGLFTPIQWCKTPGHDAPWQNEFECVAVPPGYEWQFDPCQVEDPPKHYRIEVSGE